MRSAPMLRRALTGTLLAVLASPLLAATPSATADEPGPPHAGEKYVALGDSFASGPDIKPMQKRGPQACARSTKNFASVLSTGLQGADFVDATCSGAKLTHLWAAQGEAPPQLDAITEDTTLVTFGTLGGNDVGLVGLATDCVLTDCTDSDVDYHAEVEATRATMVQGVEDVKAAAPDATIVMVGYGTYLPPGGCPGTMPFLTAAEADFLQGLIDHLSDVIGEVAADEGVLFADQRDLPGRLEHTACAAFKDQWIRGVDVGDGTDGGRLHPSSAGMRATAELIADTVGVTLPPTDKPSDEYYRRAKAAMKTVKFKAICASRSAKRAKFKVGRGKKLVAKVVFRVGKHKVKADKRAPYVVRAGAKKLRKVKGRPNARVTVKVKSLRLTKTFKAKRPRCIRR